MLEFSKYLWWCISHSKKKRLRPTIRTNRQKHLNLWKNISPPITHKILNQQKVNPQKITIIISQYCSIFTIINHHESLLNPMNSHILKGQGTCIPCWTASPPASPLGHPSAAPRGWDPRLRRRPDRGSSEAAPVADQGVVHVPIEGFHIVMGFLENGWFIYVYFMDSMGFYRIILIMGMNY